MLEYIKNQTAAVVGIFKYTVMGRLHSILVATVLTWCVLPEPSSALCKTIYINANGSDSECVHQGLETPCQSFEGAKELLKLYKDDPVRIEVESNVTLNSTFELANSSNIDIVGTSDGPLNLTYVKCGSIRAGFIIDTVQNFSFSNLAVFNCSTHLDEDQHPHNFSMLIRSSSDLLLRNVRFENCTGNTALALINNTGIVELDNTSFLENHPEKRKYHVEKSYPGAISIQQNHNQTTERVSYKITRCWFSHNKTPKTREVVTIENSTKPPTDFVYRGYGGALFVEFGGSTTQSSLVVEDSNFTYNAAARGGGVYAYYKDSAQNNSIAILRSKFLENNAEISGGGVNLGHYNSPSLHNTFQLTDCKFIKNTALFGAGLTFYSIFGKENLADYRTLMINNSRWVRNSASLSSAVDVLPLKQNIGEQGYLPTPEFENCTFINNTIQKTTWGHTNHNNVGVFSVTRLKVFFSKNTTFKNNLHSSLLLESGIAEFKQGSVVLFENNTGFNGGAISIYGFSAIVFNPHSFFNFSRNHASAYGGAIFYKTSDQHSFLHGSNECFLRSTITPSDESLLDTIQVLFDRNTAKTGGPAMYSMSFHSCNSHCSHFFNDRTKGNKTLTPSEIFKCVGQFNYNQSPNDKSLHPLTTSGWNFTFSDTNNFSYSVIPGDSVYLNFTVVDDFDQKVHPLLSITKEDEDGNHAAQVSIDNSFTLSNRIFPTGTPTASSRFTLTVVGVREIYFPFELTLLPCPPGYHIQNNTCTCASGSQGYTDITKCNDRTFQAQYRGNLWIGYLPEGNRDSENLYFSPCDPLLCNENNYYLPQHKDNLSDQICVENREGVLCGKCKDRHSTYYHSRNFTCGPEHLCHLGALFYFLSEIVPMVIFFIVVVTFDLSFTSGWSVGFVFFTQYLNQLTIHINPLFSYLRSPYRIFYGLFNFEFFNIESLSFCLWTDAEIQDILAVKYITIVVALGLVLLFIAVMHNNSCSRLCRLRSKVSAKTSVVKGLSAFLVICYAQCTRTTFYILRYTWLVGYNGKQGDFYSYFGGLPYFHSQHLLYAVPALIMVVPITILPPLVLLLYPFSLHLLSLCGLSEHWIVNAALKFTGVYKLMAFIDCFQSCYKDKLRFFAGLYFIYRVVILMVFTVSANDLLFSIYSEIVLIVLLGIHATVQPYKESIHNIIDSLIFFNLAIINGCAIIIKEWIKQLDEPTSYGSDRSILVLSAIQLVLLYMPMIVVLVYLGKCACAHFKDRKSAVESTEIDNILNQESNDTSPLVSTENTLESLNSLSKTDYGSFEDTY